MSQIKIMCLVIIVMTCGLYGYIKAENEKEKLRINDALIRALILLKSEIEYGHVPIGEAFAHIAYRTGKWEKFFWQAANKINMDNNNRRLEDIWKETIKENKWLCVLTSKEMEQLINFGGEISSLDYRNLINRITIYIEWLRQENNSQMEEVYRRVKVFRVLGITIGLFIAVMFI